MKKKTTKEIIKRINSKRFKKNSTKTFTNIVSNFETKLSEFDPINNCFPIKEYFGDGYGKIKAKNKLISEKLTSLDKNKKDYKGLYVFLHNKKPFYIGISKVFIKRIIQHVKGNSHQTSTLAYKIGKMLYEIEEGKVFLEKRDQLSKEYIIKIKKFLLEQEIAFIQIEDDDELALFEIYCSMYYGTMLNTFNTH